METTELVIKEITNLTFVNNDGVKYIEKGNLKGNLYHPKGFDGSVSITYRDNKNDAKQTNKITIKELKESVEKGKESLTQSAKEKRPYLEALVDFFESDKDNIKELDFSFPSFSYEDITDQEFNNFQVIDQATLESSGLWMCNGFRKLEISFEDTQEDLFSFLKDKKKGTKIQSILRLNKKDNDDIEYPVEMKSSYKTISVEGNGEEENRNIKRFFIHFDTDCLANEKLMSGNNHMIFKGNYKIELEKRNVRDDDENATYSFEFPFKIKVVNPFKEDGCHVGTNVVTIDFGTSSTCVATDGGRKLISFNDNPKDMNDYENMSSLIIYNWEEIYKAWRRDNKTIPAFNRSENEADRVSNDDHFDYGDKIQEELSNSPKAKTIDAIITNLKSLPGKLERPNSKEEITPFDKDDKIVYLTTDLTKENKETLNPIAFYGYLIGRALNLQINNKIYTNYRLTMPVNFSPSKRKAIETSLKYGIERALPAIPELRDQLNLKSEYEESVALVGAAIDLEYLEFEDDKKASLFAVFDFGGGTLDFSFGLYREADDDIKDFFEEEEEEYDYVIEIFKTDGQLIGGETLIQSLSYKLYKDNYEVMEENEIPIYSLENEEEIKNSNLTGTGHIEKVNLRSIDERLSRDFFINQKFPADDGEIKVDLISKKNRKISKEIAFSNLDKDACETFISNKILKEIENFKSVLEDVFKEQEEKLKLFGFEEKVQIGDIKILLAGNTCKSSWIQKAFKEVWDEEELNLIFINDEKEEITPKNAVAKGALMLDGFGVGFLNQIGSNNKEPLDRYLWSKKSAKAKEPLFKRDDNSGKEWQGIAKLSANKSFTVYYSFTKNIIGHKDADLKSYNLSFPIDEIGDKKTIFVKPFDGSKIHCALGRKIGGETIDTDNIVTIDLSTGGIV